MKKYFLILSIIIAKMMISGIDNVQSYVGIGDTAPDFTLISVEGDTISLSDYLGQVVLIDFFKHT